MMQQLKFVIVGAGPVGSLAALYAARRGYTVEVYELRSDIRDPRSAPLTPAASRNVAISERGINALRQVGHSELLRRVLDISVPMRGRMIHVKKNSGSVYELSQDFDTLDESNFAVDRHALNAALLDTLDALPNVKLFFNHKLSSVDFHGCKAWVEDRDWLSQTAEVSFDVLLGADGARSTVRHHMMRVSRVDYKQEYMDSLWCDFQIEPSKARLDGTSTWQIEPNHLHIWPMKESTFIAIPSKDGSFACTLVMPASRFAALEAAPSQIPLFFDAHFPDVRKYISDASLIRSFCENPHQPLMSMNCKPYHFGSSALIIGTAAHAMHSIYDHGMNVGMEDVRILFSLLDKHTQARGKDEGRDKGDQSGAYKPLAEALSEEQRANALAEYSATRWQEEHGLNKIAMQNNLAVQNSLAMRTSPSTVSTFRKALEAFLQVHFPSLRWLANFSRVVFNNKPHKERIRASNRPRNPLGFFGTLIACSCLAAGLYLACPKRKTIVDYYRVAKGLWHGRFSDFL